VTGLRTTRAPQYTQARWLTDPARLSLPQLTWLLLFPLVTMDPRRSSMHVVWAETSQFEFIYVTSISY
jgi:hypothetical protein